MRKSREETSKSTTSTGPRPQVTRARNVTKEETLDRKKRTVDTKQGVNNGKPKTVRSTPVAVTMQNGNGEQDRHQASSTVKSRTKLVENSSSSPTIASKSKTKGMTKSSADSSRMKTERRGNSEKRGTSTIFMPKTEASQKSSKSMGSKEVSKTRTSSNRNKDPSQTKVALDKEKSSSVKSKNDHSTRQRLPSRERRRSRTLSPSEVKILHSRSQIAESNSKNMVESLSYASKLKSTKIDNKIEADEKYVYEDDFEDYESDFEECTDSEVSEISEETHKSDELSVEEPIELRTEKQETTINSAESCKKSEEDRMLDSGHYELAEARRRAARIETMSLPRDSKVPETEIVIRPSISPYRDDRLNENKSLPSSTDEGFEDARSGDFAKSPPSSRITFIDFRKPLKENVTAKFPKPKVLSRGEKLLEMIKLDTVEWSILESKPIAYEEFIRTYGRLNTRQMCVQTNEDNLEVEVQTDAIERANKWTQFPAKCRTNLKSEEDIKRFRVDCLGVGGENDLDSTHLPRPSHDVVQMNEFLSQASKVMLSLLEERASSNNTSADNVHELAFSESIVKLPIDSVTFLSGRPVTVVHYSNISNRVLLTIHAPADEEIETSRDEDFVTDCSIGCVWNILQPSRPTKIFYSSSTITTCCFHSTSYSVVLAGLEDGSISLWDLAEDETCHRKIVDEANKCEWILRSPTYSSTGIFETSGHDSEIVALRVLSRIEGEYHDSNSNRFMPIQISSLDSNGRLIIWSVLRNMSRASIDDLGLSWWGDLKLVKSQEIFLNSKKSSDRNNYLRGFSDMHVDRIDSNAFFIATNTTSILHATRIGKHANPPAYKSNEMDWCGETKCIEDCPYDQPYFLVGCGDGTVRLHSTKAEKPLLQLKHEGSNTSIKALQWSRSKPLTIFVLDTSSTIHIWDLGSSDMFPVKSISTKDWAHIDSIELSPCRTTHEMTHQYIVLASDDGCVEVHRLNKDFSYSHRDATKRELNTFTKYVDIL
ncbi:cytoplasmic dynein 2 intermediate chain 1 [Venturia canescens]|uniref:cytoplasmic dynein 2 intermediate chain 1 n=1 Tax=Venturia canescens TaxID=32260 RepID=UPI001C9C4528|nr:cytoplasmic dynein 2 intermediate chain 1 [Venturia canescens]